jgi:hypothetical protein
LAGGFSYNQNNNKGAAMFIEVLSTLFLDLSPAYVVAPMSLALLVGSFQKLLFLRGSRPTTWRWPAATSLGVFAGEVASICWYYVLAILLSAISENLNGALGIFLMIYYIGGNFSVVGGVCGLFQFRFFEGRKALAYLIGAGISSLAGGLAAIGGWFLYDMLHAPFSCPVAAGSDMIRVQQPLMLLVAIVVYGIGTSLVLLLLKRQG